MGITLKEDWKISPQPKKIGSTATTPKDSLTVG